MGIPRVELAAKIPQFNVTEFPTGWGYSTRTINGATARAKSDLRRLKELSKTYN